MEKGSAGRPPSCHGGRGLQRRTLHLVDVDNLLGDPRQATRASVGATLAAYRHAVRVAPADLVVVATNPGLALEVGLAWPGPLLRAARGPDGADLALLADLADHLAAGAFPQRFSRVVIGGGDHIYEPAARRLTAAGARVVVVSRPGALARCLRASASRVVTLVT
ncbi:MAG: hypothetical protein ACRD07_10185 [Acidimicrobiales bacterium]